MAKVMVAALKSAGMAVVEHDSSFRSWPVVDEQVLKAAQEEGRFFEIGRGRAILVTQERMKQQYLDDDGEMVTKYRLTTRYSNIAVDNRVNQSSTSYQKWCWRGGINVCTKKAAKIILADLNLRIPEIGKEVE
jgi:hypothetical protein